jgi:uncharacterized protein (DUF983 family)
MRTLLRSLRLRCPVCGAAALFQKPFQVRHHCPACSALFQREAGFFVGAIMANVVTTEIVIIVVYLVCLMLLSAHYELMLTLLFIVGILFPVAFYHHSWSLWLGVDYIVESLPQHVEEDNGHRTTQGIHQQDTKPLRK